MHRWSIVSSRSRLILLPFIREQYSESLTLPGSIRRIPCYADASEWKTWGHDGHYLFSVGWLHDDVEVHILVASFQLACSFNSANHGLIVSCGDY